MKQRPTEIPLIRSLAALVMALLLLSFIVAGSLIAHFQLEKSQQFHKLLHANPSMFEQDSVIKLAKQLEKQWHVFQIAYPNSELALIQSPKKDPQIIYSTLLGNTPENSQTLKQLLTLAQQHENIRQVQTETQQNSLRQPLQILLTGEYFDMQAINPNKNWYLVVYHPQYWLPNFAKKSLQQHYWIYLLALFLISLAFFVSLRRIAKRAHSVQNRYQQFIDQNLDWIWETDTHGVIIYSSEHSFGFLGINANRLLGTKIFDLISKDYHPKTVKKFHQVFQEDETFYNLELALKHASQKKVYGVFFGQPFYDNHEQLIGFRGTCRNITAFKERQDNLVERLNFDPVTQLPNRMFLSTSLKELYQKYLPGQHYALLMMDLHGLQEINNFQGHRLSTLSLQLSAERIRKTVCQTNLVCRLNGTEFAILIRTPVHSEQEIRGQMALLAEELIVEIQQIMVFENHSFKLKANVGIALIPNHGMESSNLLAAANQALHNSKKRGFGSYHFADGDPIPKEKEFKQTLNQLQQAIKNQELELKYQLQINSESHQILAFEALIRWRNPKTHQLIVAKEFVHNAEELHLIEQLDLFALTKIFKDWQQLVKGLNLSATQASQLPGFVINVSSDALISANFKNTLQSLLESSQLPAEKLRFEISENQLVRHANLAASAINKFVELGIQFSIDQFGTGWSNLAYLQSLPISFIKLDASHTQTIASNPQSMEFTKTLIQMAHSLHIEVIAGGVETETQKKLLQQNGCTFMQGYYFSEAFDAPRLQPLIERHNHASIK